MPARRQLYDLKPTDLDRSPIWGFVPGEEQGDEDDEATVLPVDSDVSPDFSDGMFIVKARFTLADGSIMGGYLNPEMLDDFDIGTGQPVIVTEKGQVSLWYGWDFPSREDIRDCYKMLGKQPDEVFPLSISSDLPLKDGPVTGTVPGFVVLVDPMADTTIAVR